MCSLTRYLADAKKPPHASTTVLVAALVRRTLFCRLRWRHSTRTALTADTAWSRLDLRAEVRRIR
jgi:hypothetical protein